jgi:plasmid stability protein
MATLTLKNLPDTVLERLRRQAERQNRSVNREAIVILEAAVQPATPVDTNARLAQIQRVRVTPRGGPVTAAYVSRAKREGRL